MTFTGTLSADRVVTGWEDWTPGWIEIEAGRVISCGSGISPHPHRTTHLAGTIIPGFVDIHAHGALGLDFGRSDVEQGRSIANYHWSRGTTTLLASVATASLEELEASVRTLRLLAADGTIAGIHLEGPYLSEARRGAHNPSLLRAPDLREITQLLNASANAIKVVTIAPELPGAESVIRLLVEQGVRVAIGHTDCDVHVAKHSFNWGVSLATHLYNGMPQFQHRDPGPVGASLVDDRITLELILDGIHVSREAAEIARRCAPGRLVLVSDAMGATGKQDGEYEIAGSLVHVKNGIATLADGSSLAGSTKTISECFPLLMGLESMTLLEAVRITAITPSGVLGIERPGIQVGAHADVIHFEKSWEKDSPSILRVMRRGSWLDQRR